MREIKFRVWESKLPYMHDDVFIDGSGNTYTQASKTFNTPNTEIERSDDLIAMQFTGLKDANGVDIYEGDIVEFTYWWFDGNHCDSTLTGQIVYSEQSMSYQLKGVKNKEWESFTGYIGDSNYLTPFSELNFEEADFSVIGNIHQNPELL